MLKPEKGLVTRNTHVKYQTSSTQCSNIISNYKVIVSDRLAVSEWHTGQKYAPIFDLRGHKKRPMGYIAHQKNSSNQSKHLCAKL